MKKDYIIIFLAILFLIFITPELTTDSRLTPKHISSTLYYYKELDMINFLKTYINIKFIYIPNPGNGGDSLIAAGTFQLFDNLGLNYQIGDINKKYYNETIFYAGGGNLVGLYGGCKDFLNNNLNNNNKIIILPHTIKDVDEIVEKMNNNVFVICRDKKSYEYVYDTIKNKDNVYLSKDMAFYLDVSGYQNNIIKNKNKKVLNYFRNDTEKTNIKIPQNNHDLSQEMNIIPKMNNKEKVIKNAYNILDYINNYDTINTNRLHGGIGASLLNKEVNMYPNSYFKNYEVYNYSLKNIFLKTNFIII